MDVKQLLHDQGVPFDTLPHRATFSSQRLAHTLDVPGDNVAKTVVLKGDGGFYVAVLPATHFVDMLMAREMVGSQMMELANEEEIQRLFPDCELGAVPPFGSRYDLTTLVDESLTEDEYIVFDGNRHDEAVMMRYHDFDEVEKPTVGAFSRHA